MTGPRRLPPGWHAAGTRIQVVSTGEHVIPDDAPDPKPNRATRRAARRTK